MLNPLNKRFKRDLKSDFGKYVAIFLFLVFFIGAVSGFFVADNSVMAMSDESFEKYNIEDGHLSFNIKPSDKILKQIENDNDLKLYELNYKEENIINGSKNLRIYKVRDKVNKQCLMSGELPKSKDEIALDRMFAENNKIKIGDKIKIKNKNYKVSGLVALSDYSALFEKNSDMMFDAVGFGVAVMNDEGYSTLSNAHETVNYAWIYNNKPADETAENARSEKLTDSLENILKEYDEPLVQSQVDDLYDSARVYIKSLKNEFTDAENALKSKYFDAIRNAGLSDDKKLAKELGAIYVDTGAMYRAMAYYFIKKGVDKDDIDTITKLCKDVEVSISYENGEQQVILNGENITGFIRQEAVGNMASATSVYPVVREKLVELQRQLAARENVVMDGRDIGTVVLPDANVKIFLTASSKVRAKRRFDELTAKGEKCDIDAIEKDIIERDHRDMTRETSPLKQADDAVLLDSSDMTIDEVVDRMKQLVKEA